MGKKRGAEAGALTPAVFHILLALWEAPLHGYAVMQAVEESSGQKMGPGTVYGSIQRIEEAGLVREVKSPQSPAQRRRCFGLTDHGRQALQSEARRLARLGELVRSRKLVPSKGES